MPHKRLPCELGQMLRLPRRGVVILEEKILDVVAHGQATCSPIVVPCQINASKFCTGPVCSHRVVLLEDVKEVIGMVLVNKLYAEVIDDENKGYGAPPVSPKAWYHVRLEITERVEPFSS